MEYLWYREKKHNKKQRKPPREYYFLPSIVSNPNSYWTTDKEQAEKMKKPRVVWFAMIFEGYNYGYEEWNT